MKRLSNNTKGFALIYFLFLFMNSFLSVLLGYEYFDNSNISVQKENLIRNHEAVDAAVLDFDLPSKEPAQNFSPKENIILKNNNTALHAYVDGSIEDAGLQREISKTHGVSKNIKTYPDYQAEHNTLKIILPDLLRTKCSKKYFYILQLRDKAEADSWYLEKGTLPEGIYLTNKGWLVGVPEKTGYYDFTIGVSDKKGRTGSKAVKLLIYGLDKFEGPRGNDGIEGSIYSTEIASWSITVGEDVFHEFKIAGGKKPYFFEIVSGKLPLGISLDYKTGIIYGQVKEEGEFYFDVLVTDFDDYTHILSCYINVKSSVLYLLSGTPPKAETGIPFYHFLKAHGGLPPYSWQLLSGRLPDGLVFDCEKGLIYGIPAVKDETTLKVRIEDSLGKSDIAEYIFLVYDSNLEFAKSSPVDIFTGELCFLEIGAKGGQPPYVWTVDKKDLPKNIIFDKENRIIYGIADVPETANLDIKLSDQFGQEIKNTISFRITENPLSINIPGNLYKINGERAILLLDSVGGCPPYTWNISDVETNPGVLFDPTFGILEFLPTDKEAEGFTVTLKDASGNTCSKPMIIKAKHGKIKIKENAASPAYLNIPYEYQVETVGGSYPYAYSIREGELPTGFEISNDGMITGIPEEEGTFEFIIEATDKRDNFDLFSLKLGVSENPIEIETFKIENGFVGRYCSVYPRVLGGLRPFRCSLIEGGFPDGISMDPHEAIIYGDPKEGRKTFYKIKVEDAFGNRSYVSGIFTVSAGSLEIITSDLQKAYIGKQYQHDLTAVGGVLPYEWSVDENHLPEGMSFLCQEGLLYGESKENGDFSIAFTIEDSDGNKASKTLLLSVDKLEMKIITDSILEDAVLEKFYDTELLSEGGESPFEWSLAGGALPDEITLNSSGQISGFPDKKGDYNFAVKLEDSSNNSVTKVFSLKVKDKSVSPVEDLKAFGSDSKVGLCWQNPNDSLFSGVRIVRKIGSYPENELDGIIVYEGADDCAIDEYLENGITCYYTAFAFDEASNFSDVSAGSKTQAMPNTVDMVSPNDPFADGVVLFDPLSDTGFGQDSMPDVVLGSPKGLGTIQGSTDVVSLHAKMNTDSGASPPYGGTIVLEFVNNIVANGSGPDFIIFENVFYAGGNPETRWMEPAIVSVSQDGESYYTFTYDYVPHYNDNGTINYYNPYSYSLGFAGINPVFSNELSPDPRVPEIAGGDSFDLSDISQKNLKWIKYIKITATGDDWLTDMNGDRVRHVNDFFSGSCNGEEKSGFDLDAICAINY